MIPALPTLGLALQDAALEDHFSGIFSGAALPAMLPRMPITAKIVMVVGSTDKFIWPRSCWYFQNPTADFAAMITKLVPTASLMGSLPRTTNAGTIRKPPPTPTNPVKMPTRIPSIAIKTAGVFDVMDADSMLLDGAFLMTLSGRTDP